MKDVLEIVFMWRYVFLKDKVLFLRVFDGMDEEVLFEGCEVLIVLSSFGESRKWC